MEYSHLITKPNISRYRYSGIPDDILNIIFCLLYQEEIEHNKPDIENLVTIKLKLKVLEKENQSLQNQVNELQGQLLEWTVHQELEQSCKKDQPIQDFKQRLRPIKKQSLDKMEQMLAIAEQSLFDKTWLNHSISLQETSSIEVNVLAEGSDAESCWAFIFEMKNRNEKNLPSMKEAEKFVANVSQIKQWLTQQTSKSIKFICPIYLSAEGFTPSVEEWLHEQMVLTTDWAHWAR